ncbi:SMP-30/gluconolactonase/LRE family protein [Variovorax sp. J22P168]|uniref:SMP-30/gluconolactonase/LRE family protein n=1 Tax=Variovorax jilinensis TaxID=3053513 RepID=UPI002578570B|nr:SMP-30/gluconolactonase/LRE family protein [Variovorax sp. J22P168]MDM0014602.1 SMP-30/gluconolactonase/LRE family protein [Variovorax sp. J22P168]
MNTAGAVRCVLPGQDLLGETPLWCTHTQSLLWLDIDGGRLQRFHPASGRHDVFGFEGRYLGSLALMHEPGRVLIGIDLALHVFDFATGATTLLCQVEDPAIDNRLNDGRCDARGRFWVGTMDNQLHRPNGGFYRIDAEGSVQRQFGDVIVSNTVAFSPGHDTLYFSDTRRFVTWRFDFDDAAGTLGERRVFVDHAASRERPDGACVDSQGFVWNAIFGAGKVVRYTPEGKVDRVVEVPARNVSCVCLGGPELRTLYITTARKFLDRRALREQPLAGSLLALDVEVAGIEECRFGSPAIA